MKKKIGIPEVIKKNFVITVLNLAGTKKELNLSLKESSKSFIC